MLILPVLDGDDDDDDDYDDDNDDDDNDYDDDDDVEVGDKLVAVKKYDEAEPIRTPEPELIINDNVFAEIVSKTVV